MEEQPQDKEEDEFKNRRKSFLTKLREFIGMS